MGCSSSKEDNVQEPEPEKKKKSKKDKDKEKNKENDKNKDGSKDDGKEKKDKKKKKNKDKDKEKDNAIEDPPQRIEEDLQQAPPPPGGPAEQTHTYPSVDVNENEFLPRNDPKDLGDADVILNDINQNSAPVVNPAKYSGSQPLNTPAKTPMYDLRPGTSPEDIKNLQEMQEMQKKLEMLSIEQQDQAKHNEDLLNALRQMDADQKESAKQHASQLEQQKRDYETILAGNQEEIKELQRQQQEELHKLQEQQQAALNQQTPVKPATAVSVRPQTYQTDPGTSISQRPVKTPLMPPGTAATTALMENATKEEIAARFLVMKQIAARRRKDNDKLKAQLIEILAQQRNQPPIRPNTSASVIMAKRVNDHQVQRMEHIIKEQDTIISKLEHLLGRADVQPDNAFKAQIDELYHLTQQRQRFFIACNHEMKTPLQEQQALPMAYQTQAAPHAPRSVRSLPAPQPSKMEELFEKEQRKNEKLEQQMDLERREANYQKQMAERELALVQNQLRMQQAQAAYPSQPYPGQAWGAPPQGALPPVGYPNNGFPPRPY
ncbi:Oidioi.mRNA.OKI2018_I69.XSR.g15008.t2.cds [Oikopleura dioica]|uniref:Oidioi.mRNA.OKI2018_I69.XSR.g15008.t2.cds n=1 Tax=Oikopleura dioica TaxID=34765 RepID=A0ABN7SGI7_OIKDI|nr:Oidioi.mRNA.OKI2018_I69.XSR.g15008.t2.cds [Oikopleura dioica]